MVLVYTKAILGAEHGVSVTSEMIDRINNAFKNWLAARTKVRGYVQERTVYPDRGEDTSEIGPIFNRVPGRSRLYSDVYQEIANKLTHLPNFRASCRLAGSADPIIEDMFDTIAWPRDHEKGPERAKLYDRNLKAIQENTHRDFTRPRDEIADELNERYELMLRSIGMSWKPDEPLPKPQVLYEDDD